MTDLNNERWNLERERYAEATAEVHEKILESLGKAGVV